MPEPTDQTTSTRRGRLVIVVVFALFFLPIAAAYVLNVALPGWHPFGQTNHGTLVEPPSLVESRGFVQTGGPPLPGEGPFRSRWSVAVLSGDSCTGACETALYRIRQTRLALGKDAHRLARLLIVARPLPVATVGRLLAAEPDLHVLVAPTDWRLGDGISEPVPGRVYLVDPQGYLVLFYEPDSEPRGILEDLKRLLKISKIG